MKSILVIVFLIMGTDGKLEATSIWRKAFSSEYECEKMAERIKPKVKNAEVRCVARGEYLQGAGNGK